MDRKRSLIAIVGSRRASAFLLRQVEVFIRKLPRGTHVVSGGATGVDQRAEHTCRSLGIPITVVKPNYSKWHPSVAPKIRNRKMALMCDGMVAFWDGRSRGTVDAMNHAKEFGKPICVVKTKRNEALRYP